MSFESLAYRHTFNIENFPERWLPLICLYDPDLPLFPIYYFHVTNPSLSDSARPSDSDRAFGYVERLNIVGHNQADVTVVTNKNLDIEHNQHYRNRVCTEIRERFGLNNPVTVDDVSQTFSGDFSAANEVLSEIWQRVISNAYGNILPFGCLWDPILGLTRFVASWRSQSGRKGELIQTHYFASKFGVPIQSSGDVPQIDFYLLPSVDEILTVDNPLTSFPQYSKLVSIASLFQNKYCTTITIDGLSLSKFTNPFSGSLNKEGILKILNATDVPPNLHHLATECFNSFGKGPQRTVIFLMMLDDLRQGRIAPESLTASQCGSIYDSLKRAKTYQSPKAIQIYAQQSFGNPHAIPIDTWVGTFLKWPLAIWPTERSRTKYNKIFANSQNLGKTERLLWVASQARKVHSSACNDILWCTKYSSAKEPRGANPLSCNICSDVMRAKCTAFDRIKDELISFNNIRDDCTFNIITSSENNVTPNQSFLSCRGYSIYSEIIDDFSPADSPSGFAEYPASNHAGKPLTVTAFVNIY